MEELSIVQLEVRLEMVSETTDGNCFPGWNLPVGPDQTV